MFEKLQDLAKKHFEQRTIPVPQETVNRVLPHLIRDIDELQDVQVSIHDGHFDANIRARKYITVEAEIRFEITNVELLHDKQVVTLRRIGAPRLKGSDVMDRLVVAVIESTFLPLIRKDPVAYAIQGREGITVRGDCYTVDLGVLGVGDRLKENDFMRHLLEHGRISGVVCQEGFFGLRPELDGAKVTDSAARFLGRLLE